MGALDERSYRRGLILGLTMAEVMVLVLFALLLIWMVGLRRFAERKAQVAQLQVQLAELGGRVADLERQKETILGGRENANKFEEFFRELTVVKTRVAQLESQLAARDSLLETLAALGYSFADEKTAAESARDIRERLQIAAAVMKQTASTTKREPPTEAELRAKLAALAQIDSSLTAKGLSPAAAPTQCADALSRESQCGVRLNTLEGRLKNAERQLATPGRGTEKPACWADQTGRPEYIFDIALNSRSLVIRDNALPHRRTEQALLPVKSIVFDSELTQQDFRAQTRALFGWSEKEGCRFFVRVFDLTASHEKEAYKRQLRAVGEHFYYYEELTRGWGESNARAAHR